MKENFDSTFKVASRFNINLLQEAYGPYRSLE